MQDKPEVALFIIINNHNKHNKVC